MIEMGFAPGQSSPCLFRHAPWDCLAYIHGDDFVVEGDEEQLARVQESVCNRYPTKVRGIVGPAPTDVKEIIILNRVLQWRETSITLEADPRHQELILEEMGLSGCKGARRIGGEIKADADDEDPLSSAESTAYRSLAARCN